MREHAFNTNISRGQSYRPAFFSVIRIMHILKLQGFIVIYVIDLLYIGLWAKLHPISCPCNTRLSFFQGEKRNCLSSFSFDIIACPYSLKMFLTLVKGSYMSDWNSTLGPSQSKYIHVFWTFHHGVNSKLFDLLKEIDIWSLSKASLLRYVHCSSLNRKETDVFAASLYASVRNQSTISA